MRDIAFSADGALISGAASTEVLDFVRSLVANDQVTFDSQSKWRGAIASETGGAAATHGIRRRAELQRIRFACTG